MYLAVVFICNFLISNEVEHLFLYILTIWVWSSSCELPGYLFPLFKKILGTTLALIYVTEFFSHSIAWLFTLFMVSEILNFNVI